MRRFALALILLTLMAAPAQAHDPRPGAGMVILDLVVVRPVSLVGSVATTAVSIATFPITFPLGIADESADFLIQVPWRFTAARQPGSFDHYEDHGNLLRGP